MGVPTRPEVVGELVLSEHSGMATQHQISEQRKRGEEPHAEILVLVPHGKAMRSRIVKVTPGQCLLLAEKALAAYRLLTTQES